MLSFNIESNNTAKREREKANKKKEMHRESRLCAQPRTTTFI